MTRAEALAEAERRWGRLAEISDASGTCAVGKRSAARRAKVLIEKGRGASWEAAFADADRREGGAQ